MRCSCSWSRSVSDVWGLSNDIVICKSCCMMTKETISLNTFDSFIFCWGVWLSSLALGKMISSWYLSEGSDYYRTYRTYWICRLKKSKREYLLIKALTGKENAPFPSTRSLYYAFSPSITMRTLIWRHFFDEEGSLRLIYQKQSCTSCRSKWMKLNYVSVTPFSCVILSSSIYKILVYSFFAHCICSACVNGMKCF